MLGPSPNNNRDGRMRTPLQQALAKKPEIFFFALTFPSPKALHSARSRGLLLHCGLVDAVGRPPAAEVSQQRQGRLEHYQELHAANAHRGAAVGRAVVGRPTVAGAAVGRAAARVRSHWMGAKSLARPNGAGSVRGKTKKNGCPAAPHLTVPTRCQLGRPYLPTPHVASQACKGACRARRASPKKCKSQRA
jgi:hypothetical protein